MRIRWLVLTLVLAVGLLLVIGLMPGLADVSHRDVSRGRQFDPAPPSLVLSPPMTSTDFALHDAFFSAMSRYMTSTNLVNYPNSGPSFGPPGCVPIAGVDFAFAPRRSRPGVSVVFSGSASSGLNPLYTWDFGDGGLDSGITVTHIFTDYNDHVVQMTATSGCDQDTARLVVYGPNWQVQSMQPGRSLASFPRLVAQSGHYHLLWIEELDGEFDLYYAYRSLTADWSSPQRVNAVANTVAPNSRPALAVAWDGRVHVLWIDTDYALRHATLPPGGGTWQTLTVTPDATLAWNPTLTASGSGDLYAAWRQMQANGDDIFVAKYTASTGSWSASFNLNGDTNVTDQDSPAIVAQEAGGAYVVWADNDIGHTPTNSDIFGYPLDADPDNWGSDNVQPVRVNRASTADQFDPALTSIEDGTLYAAWIDGRNHGDGTAWDIYAAQLLPGKTWWKLDRRVTNNSLDMSQGTPSLSADERGQVHLTWMDNRYLELGSSWGVFYSYADAPENVWVTNQRVDITDEVLPGQWPSIASDPMGNLSVIWRGFEGASPKVYEATQPGLPILQSVTPNTVDNTWGEDAWLYGITTTEVIVLTGENFLYPSVEIDGIPLIILASSDNTITATLSQAFPPGVYGLAVFNRETRPSNEMVLTITNQLDNFGLSAVGNQIAGQTFPLTVQALDRYDLPVTNYSGSPGLVDRSGTLSPSFAGPFTVGQWSGQVSVTQVFAGDVITVTEGPISNHSIPFTVTTALTGLHHFAVGVALPVTAGTSFTVSLTAQDEYDNTMVDYIASNTLTDTSRTISPTQTGSFVAGVWQGQVSVTRAGTLTLTTKGGGKSGTSVPFPVQPGALDHLEMSPVSTQTAGVDFTLVITAADGYGNPVPFASTIALTDTTGTISPTTLTSLPVGVWSGSVYITQTAPGVEIAASGASLSVRSNAFSVEPGLLSHYDIAFPYHGRTAGTRFYVQVEARDTYDNVVETDSNTVVTLTSTLADLDCASNTLTLAVGRAGTWVTTTAISEGTISVYDEHGHNSTGPEISIAPALLDHVILSPPQISLLPYDVYSFTIEAFDQYGNPIADADVSWDILDDSGVIDKDGIFIAGPQAGTYTGTIQAVASWRDASQTAYATVTVLHGSLDRVHVMPGLASLPLAGQQDFDAQGYDAYGNPLPGLSYTWDVITPAGSIDQDGFFQAGTLAGDFADAVMVSCGTFSDAASISIEPGPSSQAVVAASQAELLADGQSHAILTICLTDVYDNPVADNTPVTVTVDSGSISWSGDTTEGCTNRLLTAADTPGVAHIQVEGLPTSGDTTIVYHHLPPTVYFSALPLSGTVPLTVTFVPTTTGIISTHTWLFGDGNVSQAVSPTHVYTSPGAYVPALVVTGPGGTVTGTSFSAIEVLSPVFSVTLAPSYEYLAIPGATLVHTHLLTNAGNVPDTYDLMAGSTHGWVTLATSTPISLPPLATTTVQVSIVVPSDVLSGTVDATVLTATSRADTNIYAMVTDTTTISHTPGIVWATGGYHQYADPGDVITFVHGLTNTGNYTDTFALTHHSGPGWLVEHDTLISVGYRQTATVWISLTVPMDALSDTVDVTVVTATSQADTDVYAIVTDTTTVNQIARVELTPNHTGSSGPDTLITYTHVLTNAGNGSDSFVTNCQSSQGWNVDCSGPVVLDPNQTATIVVSVTVPAGVFTGTVDHTIITATSQFDPAAFATVTDSTTVNQIADLIFLPDRQGSAQPEQTVYYTHTLTNMGNGPDTLGLTHHNSQDWAVNHSDLIHIGSGQTATVVVSITVPAGIPSSTVDITFITATSQFDPAVSATVTDFTTINQVADLAFFPNRQTDANPGQIVVYTHTLTNIGNGPDTFDLTHHSSQGWIIEYNSPVSLDYGQTTAVIISITVPPGIAGGTVDTTIITVTSRADPGVYTVITDTTTVEDIPQHQYIYLPLVIRND